LGKGKGFDKLSPNGGEGEPRFERLAAPALVVAIGWAAGRAAMSAFEVAAVLAGVVGAVDVRPLVAMDSVEVAMRSGLGGFRHDRGSSRRLNRRRGARVSKKNRMAADFFRIFLEPSARSPVEQFG
jgi:hypothetical protein